MDILISVAIGFIFGAAVLGLYRRGRRRGGAKPEVSVHSSIEEMRSVGELVVFKIITKEIVTAAEHWLGEPGARYFKWLITEKKLALVFEFDIDFRYDLRSPEFEIVSEGEADYRLKMPQCFYETHIRDITFYDEQESKFMPWLLPDLINRVFGGRFDEKEKNRLKEAARLQASKMAEELVRKLRGEVQTSARQTLTALARGFGAERVAVDFGDRLPEQRSIEVNEEANETMSMAQGRS